MKFLSIFIIMMLLVWTWKEVNAPASVALTTHVDLQENLQNVIRQKIQELSPSAKDVVFQKMWTRAINPNEVEAFFEYSFLSSEGNQPAVRMKLSGRAHLSRTAPAPVEESWAFDKLTIDGQEIEFEDDTVIKPGAEPAEDATADQPAVPVAKPTPMTKRTQAPAPAESEKKPEHP